jgi:hypothetical protein
MVASVAVVLRRAGVISDCQTDVAAGRRDGNTIYRHVNLAVKPTRLSHAAREPAE